MASEPCCRTCEQPLVDPANGCRDTTHVYCDEARSQLATAVGLLVLATRRYGSHQPHAHDGSSVWRCELCQHFQGDDHEPAEEHNDWCWLVAAREFLATLNGDTNPNSGNPGEVAGSAMPGDGPDRGNGSTGPASAVVQASPGAPLLGEDE